VAPLDSDKQILDWEQARCAVIEAVRQSHLPLSIETVALTQAHRRVLSEDIAADRDYPALARSLRDGFAVHASDVPGTLQITGEVRAGQGEHEELLPGHALEIMTGAPVPAGADAIIMVEHVQRHGDRVTIPQSANTTQFINARGAEVREGVALIHAGARLDSSHIATLAMTGHTTVEVYRKPSIAILSTGDELVPISETPLPHQIRNSNSYALASLVVAAGGKANILPVAPDTEAGLLASLERGLAYDMLLISGGVSAGKYDLVKPCLRKLGAEFIFERIRIQPGQPTAFGHVRNKFVFGLPGNPGSSMVTFQLFAKAAIHLLSGETEALLPILRATFEAPFKHKLGLTRFLPARLSEKGMLRHIPWQGSSDIPALARANVFLIADHDRESWAPNDTIRVMLKS
jgi:molybdopterin molybdotransferase